MRINLCAVKYTAYQNGAALVVSLLFLLVTTLTGLAAMQMTALEEKMSGNMRDRNLAFQAAESALRAGETYVNNNAGTASFGCNPDCPLPAEVTVNSSIWSAATAYSETLAHVAEPPKYYVELVAQIFNSTMQAGQKVDSGQCYYRVTALGVGGSTHTKVILQAIYSKPTINTATANGVCHG